MTHLLDTHLLLWAAAAPARLSADARTVIANPDATLHYSALSIWEIAIKTGRRPDFTVDPADLVTKLDRAGYREVPFTALDGITAAELPPIHADPFDRGILAAAIRNHLTLLTHDKTLASYPGPVQYV